MPAGPTGDTWFPAFRIPLTAVAKSYPQGTNKREAIIEFQRDEEDMLADKTPQVSKGLRRCSRQNLSVRHSLNKLHKIVLLFKGFLG